MKLTVTQVTEIEVADNDSLRLASTLQNNYPEAMLEIIDHFGGKVTNTQFVVTRHNLTIADLEKSGEI